MPEQPRPFDAPEVHLAAYYRDREAKKLRDRLQGARQVRLRFGLAR